MAKNPPTKSQKSAVGGAAFGWSLKGENGHGFSKEKLSGSTISIFHLPFPVEFLNHFQFRFQLHVGIQPFFLKGLSGSTNFVAMLKCRFGPGAAAMRNQHVEVTLFR